MSVKQALSTAILLSTAITSFIPYSQKANANPATAATLVTACLASSACSAVVVTIGGVAYWQITRNHGKPILIPWFPMIDDPEAKTESFTEAVNATSHQIASEKCNALAAKYAREGKTRVSVLGVRSLGNGLYECKFESEVR